MIYNKISRRYFLQGLGASLALPYLPSVMPLAHAQGTSVPLRYVQYINAYGVFGSRFWPSSTGMSQVMPGVSARNLSAVSGDVSQIIGPAFTPFKNKMSVVRNLHILAASDLHNGSYPTCASGTPEDNMDNGRPVFSHSIDHVLSGSSIVYPDATGKQRLVNFCPAPESYDNFSWTTSNGAKQHISNTTATSALMAKFTFGATPAVNPTQTRKLSAVQGVYQDYRSLRDSGKLSSEDRIRLEQYMGLINETERGLQAVQANCSQPTQESEGSNKDIMHRNQANILVAAMACDLTRVASYVGASLAGYGSIHTWSHDGWNNSTYLNNHVAEIRKLGEKLAYLMARMDSIVEANGRTMLDNTIVLWSNEYGDQQAGGTGPHTGKSMPVVVAGGAGRLELGKYIDYGSAGMPYNNLLVTMFNCMGVNSSGYERDGVAGFGEYNSSAITRYNLSSRTSTTERRKALPYLYKGTVVG